MHYRAYAWLLLLLLLLDVKIHFNKCSKCPPSSFTQALSHFRKSTTDLQIVPSGKLSQITCSASFRSDTFCGFGFNFWNSQTLRPVCSNPMDLDQDCWEAMSSCQWSRNNVEQATFAWILYHEQVLHPNWIILFKQFVTWNRWYSVIYDVINNVTVLLVLNF